MTDELTKIESEIETGSLDGDTSRTSAEIDLIAGRIPPMADREDKRFRFGNYPGAHSARLLKVYTDRSVSSGISVVRFDMIIVDSPSIWRGRQVSHIMSVKTTSDVRLLSSTMENLGIREAFVNSKMVEIDCDLDIVIKVFPKEMLNGRKFMVVTLSLLYV